MSNPDADSVAFRNALTQLTACELVMLANYHLLLLGLTPIESELCPDDKNEDSPDGNKETVSM